ncbi:MAG: hypothetical protein P4L34_09165 [Paludibacter sp.]|nr:hypothetical protein [Paludibacter sp.]
MGLFDLFKRKSFAEQNKELEPKPEEQDLPEIKQQDFIDNSDPNVKENALSVTMPMDEIYKYLQIDFESRGYEDALSNPDISYRDMNKKLIISNLKVLFKQIKQIYIDSLSTTDFHIRSRSQAGLIDIVDLLKNRKGTLESHLKEINKMEEDLEKGEDYMIGMLLSYERGFLRGLAALSLETLKLK